MIKIAKNERVYVNRSLNFGHIKMVGFDMDHTLAPYKREVFEALAFRETLNKLITIGYPAELENLTFNPNFLIRGLLVDRVRGNILKVDSHKYVKDVYHGHKQMAKEDRHKLYNNQPLRIHDLNSVDTFFALSEVQLFAEIVDYMANHPGVIEKSFKDIYDDVQYCIDLSHRDGTIKNQVLKSLDKYIVKDNHLATTLIRLIDGGKTLFLLTNSNYEYTKAILSYLLDNKHQDFPTWEDYFAIKIVGASKPDFFVGNHPFFKVMVDQNNLLALHAGELISGDVYQGGNAKLLEKLTNIKGDEILYVGDHIFGDIIRSKGSLNWRTMLVLEELNEEIPKLETVNNLQAQINNKIDELETFDETLHNLRSKIAANKRQIAKLRPPKVIELEENERQFEIDKLKLGQIQKEIKDLINQREKMFHPIWGELMKVSLERSRFANQVHNHACIYTSKVSNLRFYSAYKKFVSYYANMPHDEG